MLKFIYNVTISLTVLIEYSSDNRLEVLVSPWMTVSCDAMTNL